MVQILCTTLLKDSSVSYNIFHVPCITIQKKKGQERQKDTKSTEKAMVPYSLWTGSPRYGPLFSSPLPYYRACSQARYLIAISHISACVHTQFYYHSTLNLLHTTLPICTTAPGAENIAFNKLNARLHNVSRLLVQTWSGQVVCNRTCTI